MELGPHSRAGRPATGPARGWSIPKTEEKPPFQTVEEIERQIAKGELTDAQKAELWESLYLRVPEVAELLACVEANAAYPVDLPAGRTAAHTGMRRSELIRVEGHGRRFRRRQHRDPRAEAGEGQAIDPPGAADAARSGRRSKAWLAVHPGGNALFCHSGEVRHSSKRSRTTGHQNGKGRPTTLKGRLDDGEAA